MMLSSSTCLERPLFTPVCCYIRPTQDADSLFASTLTVYHLYMSLFFTTLFLTRTHD